METLSFTLYITMKCCTWQQVIWFFCTFRFLRLFPPMASTTNRILLLARRGFTYSFTSLMLRYQQFLLILWPIQSAFLLSTLVSLVLFSFTLFKIPSSNTAPVCFTFYVPMYNVPCSTTLQNSVGISLRFFLMSTFVTREDRSPTSRILSTFLQHRS